MVRFLATSALLAASFITPVLCSLQAYSYSDLTCHNVTKNGIGKQCCTGSYSPTTWGQDCNGDLQGDTPGGACEANEMLGQNGFQNSYPVNTGGLCYDPGNCYVQNYVYNFQCCPCPAGTKLYTYGQPQPNCYTGALCMYCNGPGEQLQGSDNNQGGFSCVVPSSTSTSVAKTLTSSKISTSSKVSTTSKTSSSIKVTTTSTSRSSSKSSSTLKTTTTKKP